MKINIYLGKRGFSWENDSLNEIVNVEQLNQNQDTMLLTVIF